MLIHEQHAMKIAFIGYIQSQRRESLNARGLRNPRIVNLGIDFPNVLVWVPFICGHHNEASQRRSLVFCSFSLLP